MMSDKSTPMAIGGASSGEGSNALGPQNPLHNISAVLHSNSGFVPLAGRAYKLQLGEGEALEGTTDEKGYIQHKNVPMGDYTLTIDEVESIVPTVANPDERLPTRVAGYHLLDGCYKAAADEEPEGLEDGESADQIHATLAPLDTKTGNTGEPPLLTLKFDSVEDVDSATVQVVEPAREYGYLAQIKGKLVKDSGARHVRFVPSSEAKAGEEVSFRLQFEGDERVYEIAATGKEGGLYDIRGKRADGAYEIQVGVWDNGRDLGFVAGHPAFIRGVALWNDQADSRPVASFIQRNMTAGTGGLSANDAGFYKGALAYFEPISDGAVLPGSASASLSLQEVILALQAAAGSGANQIRDMTFPNWGQINLVSHGNREGWTSMPLFSGRDEPDVTAVLLKHLSAHARQLEATPGLSFSAPDELVTDYPEICGDYDQLVQDYLELMKIARSIPTIDASTVIVWRGCNLGNSQEFLDAVRDLFGGQCCVYAPKYFQGYRQDEYGWEFLSVGSVIEGETGIRTADGISWDAATGKIVYADGEIVVPELTDGTYYGSSCGSSSAASPSP
jgi:hypothetical protein